MQDSTCKIAGNSTTWTKIPRGIYTLNLNRIGQLHLVIIKHLLSSTKLVRSFQYAQKVPSGLLICIKKKLLSSRPMIFATVFHPNCIRNYINYFSWRITRINVSSLKIASKFVFVISFVLIIVNFGANIAWDLRNYQN